MVRGGPGRGRPSRSGAVLPEGVLMERVGFGRRPVSVGCASGFTGRALGLGGMARPRRGVLVPLLLRPDPGIGGRSKGAEVDMMCVLKERMKCAERVYVWGVCLIENGGHGAGMAVKSNATWRTGLDAC